MTFLVIGAKLDHQLVIMVRSQDDTSKRPKRKKELFFGDDDKSICKEIGQ